MRKVKVAVVQAASVLFDKIESIKKACQLVEEAGDEGSEIVLLPEAFIPAYPRGFTFGMKIGSRNEEGGNLMGKHRKLKPTGSERLIWGEGDGSTMPVI